MSLSVHIKKRVGDFQLTVDFEHTDGVTGILGASGCGKSMTLKCIAGIMKPDEGSIVLSSRVLFDSEKKINLKPQERNVGYLFQNYALFPNMTVEQNVLCGMSKEKNKAKRNVKLQEMMEIMELSSVKKLFPHQLSGGQQQRCALARILVSEPEVLLLDEPFSALDSYLREQLQTQVRAMLERFGKDVLMVSHSRDEVYYLCNQVAIMNQGSILNQGKTKDVFADPQSKTAAILTGCKNIADAHKAGEYEVYVPDWGIKLQTKVPVKDDLCAVGLRAHYFNPKARENNFPVSFVNEREDPFEFRLLFRYENQKEGTQDIWWRLPKDRRPEKMPECLGIAPVNVLLFYPEQIYENG